MSPYQHKRNELGHLHHAHHFFHTLLQHHAPNHDATSGYGCVNAAVEIHLHLGSKVGLNAASVNSVLHSGRCGLPGLPSLMHNGLHRGTLPHPRGPWPEGALQFWGHLNKSLSFLQQFLLQQEIKGISSCIDLNEASTNNSGTLCCCHTSGTFHSCNQCCANGTIQMSIDDWSHPASTAQLAERCEVSMAKGCACSYYNIKYMKRIIVDI